jgi:transposase, IS30 family
VSHETIYLSLFVQSRGALRRELQRCLRTGRAMRHPRGKRLPQGRGQLRDVVLISQRPAEAEDRAVPGHWEGDLLLGKRPSAVATLVERTSRYLTLVALPDGYKAEQVRPALAAAVARLPEQLRRSLTWDQGKEMAEHTRFTVDTGVQVYFCDPRSPWQRGSNENTNGLLRQYLPRSGDLCQLDQAALDAIAAELNGRPRQTLGFKHPYRHSRRRCPDPLRPPRLSEHHEAKAPASWAMSTPGAGVPVSVAERDAGTEATLGGPGKVDRRRPSGLNIRRWPLLARPGPDSSRVPGRRRGRCVAAGRRPTARTRRR